MKGVEQGAVAERTRPDEVRGLDQPAVTKASDSEAEGLAADRDEDSENERGGSERQMSIAS